MSISLLNAAQGYARNNDRRVLRDARALTSRAPIPGETPSGLAAPGGAGCSAAATGPPCRPPFAHG